MSTAGLAMVDVLAWWSAVWPYLAMLLGFSAIIFVHELGHFAVAKWAGVRVERFAIGFGRELFGFTRGETRYSFNLLPVGGYVKMLGQEDFDDKSNELRFKDDPRSFVNKPVGHRMAIVSAGVIMNVLFACLLFMIVFMVGMDAVAPRIAYVEPDSPAERAGLLPGDEITAINDNRVLEFDEITMAIVLAQPHEPLKFDVLREGKSIPPIYVKPEYRLPDRTRDFRKQMIGIGSGVTNKIIAVGPQLAPDNPKHPRPGDRLVEVAGTPVTEKNASRLINTIATSRDPVVVERTVPDKPDAPPERVTVEIPPQLALYPSDPKDPESASVLGLTPLVRLGYVEPQRRAYWAGLDTGDTILEWDDIAYPSNAEIAVAIRDCPERDIPFRVIKADGRIVSGAVRPKTNRRGPRTIQALIEPVEGAGETANGPRARLASVRRGGITARAGVDPGDLVVRCGIVENPTASVVNGMIRRSDGGPLSLIVQKPDGRQIQAVVQPIAPGSIDANYHLLADDLLIVGKIVPEIHGAPSPAARLGLARGSKITAVNGTSVSNWTELIEAFRAHAGSEVELSYLTAGEESKVASFSVPHSLRTLLGVGPEARILTIDGKATATIETERGKEEVPVRYHEGTRALLAQFIGRTNVPVEFRRNVLSLVETASIDVTADMTDPWLGRIALAPNIELAPQTTLLKGKNVLDAVMIGIHKTYYFVAQVYQMMHRMIVSRSVSVDAISGPLGIVDIGGRVVQAGMVKFLFFLAIISANLAVINFLPLPIVDGGLMVFLIIEKIKGSPVSLRVQVATQMIGIFLIIGMFLFVTYNDIMRMFG